jgi:MoxR-like ATPase
MVIHSEYVTDTSDPMHVITNQLLERSQPVLLMGPPGCGKTEHIKNWARENGRECYQVQGHPTLTFQELVGEYRITANGGTEFVYGPLGAAVQKPAVFLLDEAPACESGTLLSMNEIANGGMLSIVNGNETIDRIEPDKDFVLAMTGNPWRKNIGNNQFSLALVDRFYVRNWTFLKPETEERVIQQTFPDVSGAVIGNLVALANEVRSQRHDRGQAKYVLTTRGLKATTYLISELGLDPGAAIMESIIPAAITQSESEAEAIRQMAAVRNFNVPATLPTF